MDINKLPEISGIPAPVLSGWLDNVYKSVGGTPVTSDVFDQALQNNAPKVANQASRLAEVRSWLEQHQMISSGPLGVGLTVQGLVFATQQQEERLGVTKAWDKVRSLLERVTDHNNAGVAPKVLDVLMFGSMQRPDSKDFGDADLVVIFENAPQEDIDAAVSSLRNNDNFLSLESQGLFVRNLLEQDKDFSMTSLTGRKWSEDDLSGLSSIDAKAVSHALAQAPAKSIDLVNSQVGIAPVLSPSGFLQRLGLRRPAPASVQPVSKSTSGVKLG